MASWSIEDLKKSLILSGVQSGSDIFIHANLGLLGKSIFPLSEIPSAVLKTIEDIVGDSGSIYLPAFTYSAGKGEVYKPYTTQGLQEMGSLSLEAFARSYKRSMDPMFSVLYYGKKSLALFEDLGHSSFGPKSFFERAVNYNLRMLLFCVGSGTTLLHEIERQVGVNYRKEKLFSYEIQRTADEPIFRNTWTSYVRDLEDSGSAADFRLLSREFLNHPNVFTVRLGKGSIVSYELDTLKKFVQDKLIKNPWYLTKNGYQYLDIGHT
jgi:aminoglycoside N3'-acetyltransferase